MNRQGCRKKDVLSCWRRSAVQEKLQKPKANNFSFVPMDHLPPEILVNVLSLLPSPQKVNLERINRSWQLALVSNRSIWQTLDLIPSIPVSSILNHFLLRSNSTINSIYINHSISDQDYNKLADAISTCSSTMSSICVGFAQSLLLQGTLLREFSQLRTLKILTIYGLPKVRVVVVKEVTDPAEPLGNSSKLESLWLSVFTSNDYDVFKGKALSNPEIRPFPHLTTLSIGETDPSILHSVLDMTSSTLKFLRFVGAPRDTTSREEVNLDKVKVIELYRSKYRYLPKWLKATKVHTLILATASLGGETIWFPPSIKTVWCLELYGRSAQKLLKIMETAFKEAEEIRLEKGFRFDIEDLMEMARRRKSLNAQTKRLVMDVEPLEESCLQVFKQLEVELLDVRKVNETMEI